MHLFPSDQLRRPDDQRSFPRSFPRSLHDILRQIIKGCFPGIRHSLTWNFITQDAFGFSISLLGESIKTREIRPDETGLNGFSIDSRSEGQPWPRPELQDHGSLLTGA